MNTLRKERIARKNAVLVLVILLGLPHITKRQKREILIMLAQIVPQGDGKRKGKKADVVVKKIKAALNWPTSNGKKLIRARRVQKCLTNNSLFPLPWPTNIVTLANLGTHTDAFESALGSGDAGLISSTETVVHDDLINIMSMVQIKMNSDRPNAENICTGAGYDIKKEAPHSPRANSIKPGNEPGSAIFTAIGTGPHEWEVSIDGGTTFKGIPSTRSGKTSISNFASDIDIWQRNRTVLANNKYGDWTQWIEGKTGK